MYLQHLQLPLSLIHAVGHKGKNTSFGAVLRSACTERDGMKESQKEKWKNRGKSNSIILSPFSLSPITTFHLHPSPPTHRLMCLSPFSSCQYCLDIFMYVTWNVSAWLYLYLPRRATLPRWNTVSNVVLAENVYRQPSWKLNLMKHGTLYMNIYTYTLGGSSYWLRLIVT